MYKLSAQRLEQSNYKQSNLILLCFNSLMQFELNVPEKMSWQKYISHGVGFILRDFSASITWI